MADVTDEQHQNTAGLVQADDFNAEVVVRFLRENGIDAWVDEPTGGFRYKVHNPAKRVARALRLRLPARIDQLRARSHLLVHQGEAMISKHSPTSASKRWNGHRRTAPVEPLSARIFRLRIARGYSVYDLSTEAAVLASTIQRLESGKPADKSVLPALAAALGVPLCRLVCGEHNCTERACVRSSRLRCPRGVE
ncbi:MAG: helix-turn-helix transcriptional regulator [Candidatus Eremiobacteraeota bacterium]|nr:helix-turn-helix transcriptional regulator [Candidatus Eremiobacteraeota bacterium]